MSKRILLFANNQNNEGSKPVQTPADAGFSFLEAALTAALFTGSNRLIYGAREPILGKNSLINTGVLAGSVLATELTTPYIRELMPQLLSDTTQYITNPLMSGAYYALITKYLTKTDNRSLLVKILHGGASNMVAKNIEQPIRNLASGK